MYCIKCGVQLADTEKQCPLCQTQVCHPTLSRSEGDPLYPAEKFPSSPRRSKLIQSIMVVAFLLPLLISLLCDLQINHRITWSGYVVGALIVAYVCLALPMWFQKPNPVIFVPCAFGVVTLYLLYINLVTGGHWFLGFAFPVVGGIGVIATAFVTLMRYLRGGKLYIFGGTILALGLFMFPVELLVNLTFHVDRFVGWSMYPLISLVLLGGLLIFLAICRPARETMERKFFI